VIITVFTQIHHPTILILAEFTTHVVTAEVLFGFGFALWASLNNLIED